MNSTSNGLETRALRAELRDFYEDYAICLDDGNLEAWPDFFTEDCHYRVLSRENYDAGLPIGAIYCMNRNMLRDRVTGLRETTVFEPRSLRHFVSCLRIREVSSDTIKAEANFAIMESLSDRDPKLNMVGRYIDTIRRTRDGFLFAHRDCVHDNYRVLTSLIVPV